MSGLYNERRRHMEVDEDEEDGYKRRRGPEINDIEARLQHLIVRIGEKSSSSLESNLESLAQVLESDIETYKERIIDILSSCVRNSPDKLTIYSTLVGLLNAKKYNFGGELIEALVKDLVHEIERNEFSSATYIVIFLSDLVNCRVVSVNSLMEFLEELVDAAFEENVPQVRTDWFVYCVLHALPWVGQELNDKKKDELANLLEGVSKYLESRQKLHVKMLQVWYGSPHEQEEYLDCLWAQICKLKDDDWKEKHISRPYFAFDGTLADALQHNLPSFVVPFHTDDSVYPIPSVVFRLFDYADCPEDGPVLPGAHSIERFLMEEELGWIIERYRLDRKECAAQLLGYSKRTTVPLNYVILEVLFSQLFRLPDAPNIPLFYGSLLIELCKNHPNSMPQVLAQAAELFYQRIDTMQPACVDRLIDWFSYHLSNFQYRWSWADWNDCLEMDRMGPKQIFAREVLEKCMRLSYYERVLEFTPDSFTPILPRKPVICYELNQEDHPFHQLALSITSALRDKLPADDMLEFLRKDGEETISLDTLATFFTVLLNLAQKSFSHNFAALTRYHHTLKEIIGGSEDAQQTVLRTLYQVWKNRHQMLIVLVDKLLKMSLVESAPVVAWLFSDEMKNELERMWAWEVLCIALERVNRHVDRISSDLKKMKRRSVRPEGQSENENPEGEEMDYEDQKETELPTNEEITAKEGEYNAVCEYQKNLLLSVLHKFTVLLTEHIVNAENDGIDFNTEWFRYFTGRFRHVFLKNSKELWKYKDALESELFESATIDPNVLANYHQFRSLRS
ncbi:hypothetical protein AB6A40_005233 [Gnathostoma spinigerum]|uniref:Nuclear cap-binding protein subunit 1 n=1 Tax=Gnathostoma spinigerum TaxID=75299 RepID=A0ABD6EEU9_9BILA